MGMMQSMVTTADAGSVALNNGEWEPATKYAVRRLFPPTAASLLSPM